MKSSWLQDRIDGLDDEGKLVKADWSKSEQATVEADLAEADYIDAELGKILEGQITIGGKKIGCRHHDRLRCAKSVYR